MHLLPPTRNPRVSVTDKRFQRAQGFASNLRCRLSGQYTQAPNKLATLPHPLGLDSRFNIPTTGHVPLPSVHATERTRRQPRLMLVMRLHRL